MKPTSAHDERSAKMSFAAIRPMYAARVEQILRSTVN